MANENTITQAVRASINVVEYEGKFYVTCEQSTGRTTLAKFDDKFSATSHASAVHQGLESLIYTVMKMPTTRGEW